MKLKNRDSGMAETHAMITNIIRLTIETGSLTGSEFCLPSVSSQSISPSFTSNNLGGFSDTELPARTAILLPDNCQRSC